MCAASWEASGVGPRPTTSMSPSVIVVSLAKPIPASLYKRFRGVSFILNFKSAHRATLEAIPDPGPVCRNRHCCRYQKWKGRGRFARSPCRPAPREWWSALDSQLRRDGSGTEGSRRGRSRPREEVGSSYSPWLNNRIDWECATGMRSQSRPNQGPAEAICNFTCQLLAL